ncbi:MAG: ABC transporter ATP-binding protein [Lachnospiraceae bacterium]|nr:ABC transporter ATP-binding protein [Lachnospiraceae bacterium]
MNEEILQVRDLLVKFHTKYGTASAVNHVSFSLARGEKLGIVGESGSGKSVTSKSIIRLLQTPPAEISGEILFHDTDLLRLSEKAMQHYRGNKISMIFQEPMVSLNPLYTIGNQMSEVLFIHEKVSKAEARERVLAMLRTVEIPSPEERLRQYPFELSGGMRQRVMIAMSLLCHPEILIADEPTTALDVTIQAQILDLLNELNRKFNTSIIMITHDLGVIAEMVDRVAVMYAGRIVESAPVKELFSHPQHPYTIGLLNAIPKMKGDREKLETIEGTVPSLYQLPEGCAFANRCTYACSLCRGNQPPEIRQEGHSVRCFRYTDEWKES